MKIGTDFALEEAANALLREGRRGVTALSAKRDYLTDEQLALRQSREVLNMTGVADESLYSGLYRRAFNPLAGKRPKRINSSD